MIKLSARLLVILVIISSCTRSSGPYLETALKAANWLQSNAIKTETGKVWAADPADSSTILTNLYSGSSGVVLFFLELYYSTGEISYLDEARAGADYLIEDIPDSISIFQTGFYTGIAGTGFVLEETYKASGQDIYRNGALKCIKLLEQTARTAGAGIEWSNATDIISGSAGIGLFLLYAAKEMDNVIAMDLAKKAGYRLVELAKKEKTGYSWNMDPDYPLIMPNFAHGTAGISYFLAKLYEQTGNKEFLSVSVKGAEHLLDITNNNGFICHHIPGGEDLFYLGWCHGPAGTSKLYLKLYEETGEQEWLDAIKKSASGLTQSGIPEKRTEGFWNNISQCCGSAGVGEFYLGLLKTTGEKEYQNIIFRIASDIIIKSSIDGSGLKWIQAEHRTRPDLLVAQTGLMQGAAGVGIYMLHLEAYEKGGQQKIIFPDSPF